MATVYEVREGDTSRLVKAPTDGKAALHVLKPSITITVPTRERFYELVSAGVKIEDASPPARAKGTANAPQQ